MRWPLSLTLLLAAGSASAQPLSGAELVRELSNNTLTGFNGSLWFSEYHAPDGRVLGHNAGLPNQDACWKVRGDAVCYYYPRDRRSEQGGTAEFCWRFARAGSHGYRIMPIGRAGSGIARLEPGNARGHTSNGRAWTCEDLISRQERPPSAPFSVAAHREPRPARALLSAAPSP